LNCRNRLFVSQAGSNHLTYSIQSKSLINNNCRMQGSSSNVPLAPHLTWITGKCLPACSPRPAHAASEEPDVWRKTQSINQARPPASRACLPRFCAAGPRWSLKNLLGRNTSTQLQKHFTGEDPKDHGVIMVHWEVDCEYKIPDI